MSALDLEGDGDLFVEEKLLGALKDNIVYFASLVGFTGDNSRPTADRKRLLLLPWLAVRTKSKMDNKSL